MNKRKQMILVAAMFVLLLLMVCSPKWIMQYENGKMVDQPMSYSVEMAEYDAQMEIVENYTLWERLKAIHNADAVSRAQQPAEEDILLQLEEQLVSLQSYGALPLWDFSVSGMQQVFVSKEAYMLDDAHPELTLTVWSICAEYENFVLSAYMDTQLLVLYDVNLTSKGDFSEQYTTELFEEGYLEYLLQFEATEDEEEVFEVRVYYGMYKIYLYPVSINKKTGNYTSYCFNEDLKDNSNYVITDE